MTIAALGFAEGAAAQKDAAEKAQEGAIDHWIEYYKAEQRKAKAATVPDPPAALPAGPAAPTERTGLVASPSEKAK